MDTSIPFEAIVPPGIKIPVIESEFPKTRIAVVIPNVIIWPKIKKIKNVKKN